MMNKKGFTLAEVLITLSILGVVAAILIPNVIGHYRKNYTETRLKQAYSIMTNALDMAAVVSGKNTYGNMINDAISKSDKTGYFVQNYVIPYLSYKAMCMQNDSVCEFYPNNLKHYSGGSQSWIQGFDGTTSPNIGKPSFYARFLLKNGLVIGVWDGSGCSGKFYILVDVNGNKAPNQFGYDVFVFSIFPNQPSIVPVACRCSVNNDFTKVATSSCSGNGYECVFSIMRNNWKIPKDYPVKF